jgi:signal transduction histidine kinase
VSPVEAVEAVLSRLEEVNPVINAFVTVTAESARTQAKEAEAAVLRGEHLPPLHGVPITVKDLADTASIRTTYGCVAYADHVPNTDAISWEAPTAGDAPLLERLVHNLVENGIQHNNGPGGQVEIISRTRDDGQVEVQVRNTGPVVPHDEIPALFEPVSPTACQPRIRQRRRPWAVHRPVRSPRPWWTRHGPPPGRRRAGGHGHAPGLSPKGCTRGPLTVTT